MAATPSTPVRSRRASAAAGDGTAGAGLISSSAGFQNRISTTSATIDTAALTMSTSHGPWKLLIRNCTIAKVAPAVRQAGHTSTHPPPADLRRDQPERDDQREERQLAADHRAELLQVEAGQRRQRDERNAERSEGDRRGVADQRELGGLERLEAEPDQQPAADRHRRAEAGRALDEGAEAEGDQQRLDAAIARDAGDLPLQDDELPGLDRELVDEDRVDARSSRSAAGRTPRRSRPRRPRAWRGMP